MKKEGSRSGPRLSRFSEGRGGKKEWRKHNILYIRVEKADRWFFDKSTTSNHACVAYPICRRGIDRISREAHERMDRRESNGEVSL